jgi:hypothetical protein
MNTPMNPIDEKLCEQLCAYMDGELPADEARFLERRLANEPALRAKWERMQLASACIKGHPCLPMSRQLSGRVANALAAPVANPRQPWRLWATAASIAVLALAFAPRLLHFGSSGTNGDVTAPMLATKAATKSTASPASADFVAIESVPAYAVPTTTSQAVTAVRPKPAPARGGTDTAPTLASASGSPTADSPTEFPLVESGASKSWPRAQLPGAANDPSIEAYLVRHNQMLANDGLGGFVPYVDVVTNAPSPATDNAADAGDDSQ